ncbi:MAG: aldose epimerase family protein [Promethearchaeota archaeon]
MQIIKEDWGLIEGKKAILLNIISESSDPLKFKISLTNVGASIVKFQIYHNEKPLDILYGRNCAKDYFENKDNSYMGSIVGRVASLISFARFSIENEQNEIIEYNLTRNLLGIHHMHGGFKGLTKFIWEYKKAEINNNTAEIIFSINSNDGDEGYPGNLRVEVCYFIHINPKEKEKLEFSWKITAKSDKNTIINIINHAYWNLDGIFQSIDDLQLKLNSKEYIKIKFGKFLVQSILCKLHLKKKFKEFPIKIRSCKEDGLNFNKDIKLKDIFKKFGDLDTTFLIESNSKENLENNDFEQNLKYAGFLYSSKNRIKMKIYTTEPALTVYSGNNMDNVISFGKKCKKHYGICLETMKPPNSINIPQFSDLVKLKEDQSYIHVTKLVFSLE